MKIVEINGTNYASTGNIALNIAKEARLQGFDVFTCCKNSRKAKQFDYPNQIIIGSRIERIISEQLGCITGYKGYFNYFGTKAFIKKLKQIKPDIIHLHIMHDTFINLPLFFNYLKESNIPIVWTFHDCWAMTGQCPHFVRVSCDKWKTECHNCPQIHNYPDSYFFDLTRKMWNKKKQWFTSLKDLTIVTPSIWMSKLVKESYLKEADIRVINNGIDMSIFRPSKNDFKNKMKLSNSFIVLGVGYGWSPRKGLNDFIELSKRLPNNYKIVIVGTNDAIDKTLPSNIVSIHRTYDQKELAEIYSASDVFVNPTYEDNFPTVNIESLACGTPVITYDTGGSPEIIDETCGSVINRGDVDSLEKEIIDVCENKRYSEQACINRAKNFDMINKNKEYIELYKEILEK